MSLLIVGTASAVATLLLATGGDALGSSSAAQYEYGHPASQTAPVISGTAQVGQKLTTSNGTWSSSSTITLYGYAWFPTEQGYWNAGDEQAAVAAWASARVEQGM